MQDNVEVVMNYFNLMHVYCHQAVHVPVHQLPLPISCLPLCQMYGSYALDILFIGHDLK